MRPASRRADAARGDPQPDLPARLIPAARENVRGHPMQSVGGRGQRLGSGLRFIPLFSSRFRTRRRGVPPLFSDGEPADEPLRTSGTRRDRHLVPGIKARPELDAQCDRPGAFRGLNRKKSQRVAGFLRVRVLWQQTVGAAAIVAGLALRPPHHARCRRGDDRAKSSGSSPRRSRSSTFAVPSLPAVSGSIPARPLHSRDTRRGDQRCRRARAAASAAGKASGVAIGTSSGAAFARPAPRRCCSPFSATPVTTSA